MLRKRHYCEPGLRASVISWLLAHIVCYTVVLLLSYTEQDDTSVHGSTKWPC